MLHRRPVRQTSTDIVSLHSWYAQAGSSPGGVAFGNGADLKPSILSRRRPGTWEPGVIAENHEQHFLLFPAPDFR